MGDRDASYRNADCQESDERTALQELLAKAEELGRLTADPEVVAALRDLDARRKLGAVLEALLDGRDLPTLSGRLGAGPYSQWRQLINGDDERLALLQRLTRELGFELDFTLKPLRPTEAAADEAADPAPAEPATPAWHHGHGHLPDGQVCRDVRRGDGYDHP